MQVMEIAHTHYWTKDVADIAAEQTGHYSQFLDPHLLSPGVSTAGSPVSSAQESPEPSRRPSQHSAEHGK